MKNYKIICAILTITFAPFTNAKETSQYEKNVSIANLCAENTRECREFALAIAKKDIAEIITRERKNLAGGSFLCPESNPNCCPPHLLPLCSKYQSELIAGARAQLKLKTSSDVKLVSQFSQDCPFSSSFCTPNCEGEFLKPWGCAVDFPDLIYNPDPWDDCDKGEVHNPKGICIPKPCYFRNTLIPVPCSILDQGSNELAISVDRSTPTPILINNLNDKKVRLEAAKQVLKDLQSEINSVEKEINRLSN